MRIALLTEIPAPFRIAPFNALAATPDVDLRVLFLSDRDPKRPYRIYREEFRFSERTLAGRSLVRGGRWVIVNRGVGGELRRFDPDIVVVGGWNQPAFWQALLWARIRRRPFVVWVESTLRDERPGSGLLERAKRAMLAQATAFLVPGTASRAYLRSLGVADERIETAPNAVDLAIFRDAVARARSERGALREQLSLRRTTLLYVGRLDPEKDVGLLLAAAAGVAADVVVAGDGTLAEELRASAPANVRFVGRLDREELVRWYAATDAFVFPSRSDQWALVLNEATAAGLPVVTTDAPGAVDDLVEDGRSGLVVPRGDERAFAVALERIVADAAFRTAAGARSSELAAGYAPEAWAAAVSRLAARLRSSR
jgi:glycosyltransferase involved in cell wall biosynthesis